MKDTCGLKSSAICQGLFGFTKKICRDLFFGPQLIASALGGTVERRRDGWLLGAESFDIVDVQSWMKPTQMKCEIFHINQEHVSVLPENAQNHRAFRTL
ncbi:MAG: hypothetical protein Ct9H300mP21_06330 [Pseudomonadota bacterium]|nr:MAG: hypothetical protein Ct9H300mP21_06330 [Pseudomonadota bacterium]